MEWFDVAKRKMRSLGLRQEDFIKPLGVETRGAVGHYFTGRRTPTPAQFKAIADMLKTSMDELFSGADLDAALEAREEPPVYLPSQRPEELEVPRLDLRYSMGTGLEAPDHLEVVSMVRVNLPQLRREVTFSAPSKLRIVTGLGDSMEPTFKDGDPLILDTGVTEIRIDGVYAYSRESAGERDELFIKRVQRQPIDNTLIVTSDNPNYKQTLVISEADFMAKFEFHGRILIAWNARKL